MPIENTKRNKERRMAKHAKRYPKNSTVSTARRRAMGKAWKEEAARRSAEADRQERDTRRAALFGPTVAAQLNANDR